MPLSDEERTALLAEAGGKGGGLWQDLAWAVGTPGALVSGTLLGDPLSALGDVDERKYGRDVLQEYGVLPKGERTWTGAALGFAADVALDPLTYATFGAGALTKAGRLASRAGLLKRAPEFLSKQFVAGQAGEEIASRAARALSKRGQTAISATEAAGRPLVGQRAAQRYGTLQDLLDFAPANVRSEAMGTLTRRAGGEEALQQLLRKPLGKDASIFGIPFNVPGGTAINDALDAIGQYARWNPAGRAAAAFVDDSLGGALDAESQAVLKGADIARKDAVSQATREATEAQARMLAAETMPEARQEIMSEEGNRVLGRLIEDPLENSRKAIDEQFVEDHPAVREYAQWWKDRSASYIDESAEAGIKSDVFQDENIRGYLPRVVGSPLETLGQRDPTIGKTLSTLTPDQMRRSAAMNIPGGRDTIAFELSRDPLLVGASRELKNDAEAARYIMSKLPGIDIKQANQLARILHRLPKAIMEKVPLFGDHPTEMITQYMKRRSGAISNAESLVDALASKARPMSASLSEGEPALSIPQALKEMGLETAERNGLEVGAKAQLREKLSAVLGKKADDIELSDMSVPQSFVEKVKRLNVTLTNAGEAANMVESMNNAYIVMFKSGALNWPSRYVRDGMSGQISNWLEGAWSVDGLRGAYNLQKYSAFGSEFQQTLARIPRYAAMPDVERPIAFYADLAATELADTAKHVDIDTSGMRSASRMVGVNPEPALGAFQELAKPGGINPLDYRQYNSKLNPAAPTTNRLARAGMRASDYVDNMNRLSGYITLLAKDVAPAEAARRMKRAHVDYASLGKYERWIRDTVWPFYAYQSRMMAEVLRQIATQPGGRYAQILRAKLTNDRSMQEEGSYAPEYLRDQWAVPIGTNADGSQTFVSNIDVPGLQALDLFDTNAPVQGTAKNLINQASPLLRGFVEAGTGRDMFTDRPLSESNTGAVSSYTGETHPYLDRLVDIVPYGTRIGRLAGKALGPDARNTAGRLAVTNATGLKFTDVPQSRALDDAYRILMDDMGPSAKTMEIPYIDPELEPSLSLPARYRLELLKRLQAEANALRSRR